jgi:hypothetical protein
LDEVARSVGKASAEAPTRFRDLLAAGWRIKANALTSTFGWPAFVAQHGAETVLLFGIEPVASCGSPATAARRNLAVVGP